MSYTNAFMHILSNKFPAMKYHNFRNYWLGQSISLIGNFMQITALQWLIYTLTKSALLMGLLGVAQYGPIMCLSLFAGVIIDRYPTKKIILIIQYGYLLQTLVLTILVWSGHVRYSYVLILAAFRGIFQSFDQTSKNAFVRELVEKNDLRSAIGLNSTIFNTARMLGPAIAVLLMDRFRIEFVFFLDCISFFPMIISLYLIRAKPFLIKRTEKKILTEIGEGLNHIRQSAALLGAIFSMLAVGTLIMNFNVTAPVYADKVFKLGANGYGVLLTSNGAGSLVGALFATQARGNPKLKNLFALGLIISFLLASLCFMYYLPLAVITFFLIGFFVLIFNTTVNSTMQINSSEEFRGRVMSLYTLANYGTTPIGNMFAGSIIEKGGPGMGFFICGAVSGISIILTILKVSSKKRANYLAE
ncbi:MFS transporter [Candidatus Formimonas warabiya]|uniref:MFS transporter n=1 Tax=Formimonas warabiya TaxID=1761012 RepID=A0A3G1KXX9_FORW1|nr:MFS transporter [Candidatus Formimonas warabiya]ATW27219.1 MFS transporter [Candidatus Formimonas warabiya]